ncbi:MAG: TRC40/GET3/ArsA family transport-energizing ATPase [Anaerolineae bacterium]|nr:TRC40/GET3/ArsA family transport-energizing ATPase [Anaerolineae bacterium]
MTSQFIFFSGKGGVGKTSMACATAVRHADEGRRTLIVTTDPASNLADVFEQPIGHKITAINHVPNLWAMEIDPDQATQEYIDRAMAPLRAAFPPQMVQVMEEQMSGPCTAEVAAFDRFVDFLELPSQASNGQPPAQFDTVIFDTAPTGHTLRLIELPVAWSRSIEEAEQGSGQTCIGPAAAIQEAKHKYERAVRTLRNGAQTTFVFVLQPEATSIKETRRAIGELGKLDIHTHQLIINGLIPPAETANPLFAGRRQMQISYLAQIEQELPLPTRRMYLLDGEIKGAARLREVANRLFEGQVEPNLPAEASTPINGTAIQHPHLNGQSEIQNQVSAIWPRLLPNGHSRILFFAGKGGVGKTVASCLTAVWLARQGYKTLLLTTDPAAHLGDVLGAPVGDEVALVEGVPNLWATKIDPKAVAEVYKKRILDDARQRGRPVEAIRVMEEELNSPCTEEIAAFDQFIDYASQDKWQVIVFDTAPTGHTLRLLELPLDWSKQLDVKVFSSVDTVAADDVAKQRFGQVIEMMRDPSRSTFAFVMYPESTPIIEAYRASQELGTLDIPTRLVVANLVIPPEHATTPFSRARRTMQEKYLVEIGERFNVPVLQIPLLSHEVKGLDLLTELADKIYQNGAAISINGRNQ